MARYEQSAKELGEAVEAFIEDITANIFDGKETDGSIIDQTKGHLGKEIGYLLSKAIQCHPRPCQTTVRKNIIDYAVGKYCSVQVKEDTLPATDRYPTPKTIKKVIITPKS